MIKDVILSMSGLQLYDDQKTPPIKTITSANYYKKHGKHYILYDEVMEGFRAEGEYILGEFTKTELATSLDNLQFDLDKTVIATIKDPEEIKKGGKANSLVFLYEMQGTQGENTYAAIFFNNIVKDGTGRIAPVHQQGNVGIWGKDKAEIDKFIMEDTEVKYNLTVTE